MNRVLDKKLKKLREILAQYEDAIVAFSGGVDSTLLARVAKDTCSRLKLITASFSAIPQFEIQDSIELAKDLSLDHEIIEIDEQQIPGFYENDIDRCYHCKKYLFSKIKDFALNNNFEFIFDGTNADDTNDYRPGEKALKELGIISPLRDAGLSKIEIRAISKELGLKTESKPAYACLASRFPYGEPLTKEKLNKIAEAEEKIRELGFTQFRVRSHNNLARLEFIDNELDNAWQKRIKLEKICKNLGFDYVAIDTTGYRTGAMNETNIQYRGANEAMFKGEIPKG